VLEVGLDSFDQFRARAKEINHEQAHEEYRQLN
jgi:hypothetical protein